MSDDQLTAIRRRFAQAADRWETANKPRWIADFKFLGGSKWSDPPPTDEEAEAAWQRFLEDRPARLYG